MGNIAIRVEGLGKRYRIGELQRYKTLRDTLANAIYAPFRTIASIFNRHIPYTSRLKSEGTIWALKDVSFEVKQGEVMGIIGQNGAGKSTLLKILSRITEPTEGYAEVHGRVGSLLEIGTGFHPELTGRENIYLNGAILGMKKAEIDRKFDEIVAFAEVEKFIDTPVKHYSSGMYVRLAFSVAAHLDPEILLVDEVLAVGDAAFQQKCLLKIRELTKHGTTSLFVSHNMHYIGILAKRCLYLKSGFIVYDGDANRAIDLYLNDVLHQYNLAHEPGTRYEVLNGSTVGKWSILSLTATNSDGYTSELTPGEDLYITIYYKCGSLTQNVHFQVTIWTEQGLLVTCADSRLDDVKFTAQDEGTIMCVFPSLPLISGRYIVRAYMLNPDTDWPLASFGWSDGRVCNFLIKPKVVKMATGMIWYPTQSDFGIVRLPYYWRKRE